ncbi:uncharacterized protein [Spinacia oleracea]|uniref:Retrotransposon Copia-like N-terminal domain-containing protein n=1 Tax=Spinacia oleracea TaxID=3562 RepID=A0ABM3QQT2_SPIOL|nr:uncharacterized protein LOC130461584 [Spinacia oleracea]
MSDDKIEPSSPFYLSAGDQPSNLITHVVLKGKDNYLAWSRAITLSLKSRRKYGFVNGTVPKPKDEAKLLDWVTKNSMIVAWILKTMAPKVAISIPYMEEARPLWEYLEKRFCVSTGPRLQQLRGRITKCRQTKGMSIEDYYNLLMGLYDDLHQLKPPHGCECGKFPNENFQQKLHQFLIGIDDDLYAVVRSNLLSQKPPVTLEDALESLIQEEESRGIAHGKAVNDTVDTHVFAVPTDHWKGGADRWKDKSKLSCSHCQKTGHKNSTCFKLHGYPEWWPNKNRSCKSGSWSTRPSNSPADRNRPSGAMTSRANAVSSSVGGAVHSSSQSQPSNTVGVSLDDLKPEHIQVLLNMVNNQKQDRMIGPSLGEPDWGR